MFEATENPSKLIPASTVLLLREGRSGLEVLMLRRNRALKAFGGAWVFPGGRVDDADGPGLDVLERAKFAAIRETAEETGLNISHSRLETLSNWMPPEAEIRRFSTWFFVAEAPAQDVQIDDGEIHDYRWVNPADQLASIPDPAFAIMPPTYISLHQLKDFESPNEALDAVKRAPSPVFETRFKKLHNGFMTCWEGDCAYDNLDFESAGPRRRLFSSAAEWRYESDFEPAI